MFDDFSIISYDRDQRTISHYNIIIARIPWRRSSLNYYYNYYYYYYLIRLSLSLMRTGDETVFTVFVNTILWYCVDNIMCSRHKRRTRYLVAHSSRDFASVIIAVGGPPGVRRARPACVSGDWPPRSTRSQGSRARLPPPPTPPPPPPHAPRREKRELVCACAIRRATWECGGDRLSPVPPRRSPGPTPRSQLDNIPRFYRYNSIVVVLYVL